MTTRWIALLAVLLAGCATYKSDLETMCAAPTRAGAPADFSPADKATVMAAWIAEHISTAEAKALFAKLPTVPPAERAKLLREAAASQGLGGCGFADFYEAAAKR
jgi:hypothetical protein